MLFTQILHKKQTQKIKERLLILRDSALKGTVAQGNSWHRGVGTEPAGKKSYERRRGRWRPGLCRAVKDTGAQLLVGGARLCTRRELGSRAHTRLPLWKSAAGRFVRRGLTGIRASPPGPKTLTRAPCPVSATLPPPLVLRGSRGRLVLPSNTRLHSALLVGSLYVRVDPNHFERPGSSVTYSRKPSMPIPLFPSPPLASVTPPPYTYIPQALGSCSELCSFGQTSELFSGNLSFFSCKMGLLICTAAPG